MIEGSPRVALVHDWLTGMRGGEKVLEVFADLFPDAPIYTMVHVPGSVSEKIESHPIYTSELQQLPMGVRKYRYYLPIMPYLAERLQIQPADLVVSVSTCVAKGIVPPPGSAHASYVNSPMRYLYDRYDDYFAPGRAGLATRLAMRLVRKRLQRWDLCSTARVDSLVGNSSFIAWRIRTIYGRNSRVIHPPVDVERFQSARRDPEDYYLMVCALVPYKNVDTAVEAFRGLDRKLVVAGTGPMYDRLAADCPPNVELLGWVDDEAIPDLVAGCRAFLLPNVEDFGIAPIEAMAAGRPVIALGEGGVIDTVRDLDRHLEGKLAGELGPTGLFYQENSPDALKQAIGRFEEHEHLFDCDDLQVWSRRFDYPRFIREVRDWLSTLRPQILKQQAA